jgi:hypothetical protein
VFCDRGKKRETVDEVRKIKLTASMLRIPMMKRYQLEIWIQPFVLQVARKSAFLLGRRKSEKSQPPNPRRKDGLTDD